MGLAEQVREIIAWALMIGGTIFAIWFAGWKAKMYLDKMYVSRTEQFALRFEETLQGGLAALKQGIWNAVLLDLTLPDSSKEATLDEVKSQRRGAAVVIVTGYDEPKFREYMLLKNADGYVVKGKDDSSSEDMEWIIERAVECREKLNRMDASLKRLEARL